MGWKHILYLLLLSSNIIATFLISKVKAVQDLLTEDPGYQTRCSGMFSKSAIPGGSDPFISVTFAPSSLGDVATVIYDFKDKDKIGCRDKNSNELYKICDKSAVESKCCEEKQLGNFIVEKDSNIETYRYPDNSFFKYEVKKTGYYCVNAISINGIGRFTAILDWRNPYGELPGNDYPKLPFYGLLSLVYLGIGIIWMALSIIHWREILPVQNYISGVILFLMIEMAFNWGYWENYNIDGASSTFLLCVVSILNAGRNSISFFMLLIVCMGYGVVKPTLGSTMTKCRLLAAAHFIFGVIYAAGTMLVNPDTTGPLVFFIIFPLALTMTAFHIWTLQSLTQTIQTLEIRRQKVKALMYRRLYRLLLFSVSVLGIFFVINLMNYWHREDLDYMPRYWHWRWFLLDGWLNILYLIVFTVIIVLWRPTGNNKRFAMSDELGQEDVDDLEINNLRAAENLGYDNVKYRDRPTTNTGNGATIEGEGGAIFDIGEEPDDEFAKWTDDESHNGEGGNLPGDSQSHHVAQPDSQRISEDDESSRIRQEISKLN